MGELLCDSLVEAEDALRLRFATSANEVSSSYNPVQRCELYRQRRRCWT